MSPTASLSGYFQTSDGHKLYWERHGNPSGEPVFFVHGGPGGYSSLEHLVFFDLEVFSVVLFDQRGCGRSLPQGRLTNNCTALLVEDIDSLRQFFGFEKISLLGVSWGSWLVLQYQHQYQRRVLRSVVASVFVPIEEVFEPYDQTLAKSLTHLGSPDVPPTLQHIHDALCSNNAEQQRAAAMLWSKAQLCDKLSTDQLEAFVDDVAIASIRLDLHYHLNRYFCRPADLSLQVGAMTTMVQGVFDHCGMLSLRWLQQRSQGRSRLVRAGHNAFEPRLYQTIKQELQIMKKSHT